MTLADQQEFRDVIGRFASGVTIITTTRRRRPVRHHRERGELAVARSADGAGLPEQVQLDAVRHPQGGPFCVNILADGAAGPRLPVRGQEATSSRTPPRGGHRRHPVLGGTLAHLECRVAETVTGGTHTVFLGTSPSPPGTRAPRSPTSAAGSAAGRCPRRRPTARARLGCSPGSCRSTSHWSSRWSLAAPMTRGGARRVRADETGGRARGQPHQRRPIPPIPLTVELADQLFGARCVIQLGVADSCVGHIPPRQLAVLDDYAARLAA